MDVYGLELKRGQLSSSSIWVTHSGDGSKSSYNSVIAGWHIHQERYGDYRPHHFILIGRQSYSEIILLNLNSDQWQDKKGGDWWVYYGFNSVPTGVGYYPKSLFTSMAENANQIKLGAFAGTDRTVPSPPIGSGALRNSGQLGRVASFTNLCLVGQDERNNPITGDLPSVVSNNQCYSVTPVAHGACFCGGPGGCM
ncbi:hypothetical protein BAE44_0021596 [Dichanthelium oligosanthes]|uniref:Neprosin PEP catalytic domain-containing protein n=1 Tax=Dichanthelium oligosanthes TaxID=888268 RepID=A0A1E5UX87_9POAL|nr:hypothetical protein BAE44_0021596 [Dichanthelium oligosanthes]